MNIGQRIKFFRKKSELSRPELARRVGVSPNNVHYWESGNTTPTIANLYRIADAFEIPIELLMERPAKEGAQ